MIFQNLAEAWSTGIACWLGHLPMLFSLGHKPYLLTNFYLQLTPYFVTFPIEIESIVLELFFQERCFMESRSFMERRSYFVVEEPV